MHNRAQVEAQVEDEVVNKQLQDHIRHHLLPNITLWANNDLVWLCCIYSGSLTPNHNQVSWEIWMFWSLTISLKQRRKCKKCIFTNLLIIKSNTYRKNKRCNFKSLLVIISQISASSPAPLLLPLLLDERFFASKP